MNDYKKFLNTVFNRYCYVSDDTLTELFSICKIQNLPKGHSLLQVGTVSRDTHILYEGVIVSYYISKEGKLYHKNIFTEGDFVGSTVSALTQTSSNFGLDVIEDATLISFNYQNFRSLCDKNPELKNFYIAYLEKNWVIDKEQRELEIVLSEAKERYINFLNKHPDIENRIPLHYIASHLGITPTQLSRIRKKN